MSVSLGNSKVQAKIRITGFLDGDLSLKTELIYK